MDKTNVVVILWVIAFVIGTAIIITITIEALNNNTLCSDKCYYHGYDDYRVVHHKENNTNSCFCKNAGEVPTQVFIDGSE